MSLHGVTTTSPKGGRGFHSEPLTSIPFTGLPQETYSGGSPPQARMVGPLPSHKVGLKRVFDLMGTQEVWEGVESHRWLLPPQPSASLLAFYQGFSKVAAP